MSRRLADKLLFAGAGLALAAVVLLVVLLGSTAGTAFAAPRAFAYHVVHAHLNISDVGKYRTDFTTKWDGSAHEHFSLADDPELPNLPTALFARGGTVQVSVDRVTDGDETSIDSEGKKQPCSGVFGDEDQSTITVKLKPHGEGKVTSIWHIDHGFASGSCGIVYDLFGPDDLVIRDVGGGEIGNNRLVLTTRAEREKREATARTNTTQTLKWEGRLVLKRAR